MSIHMRGLLRSNKIKVGLVLAGVVVFGVLYFRGKNQRMKCS